jgi:hypothetical protein
MKKRIAGLLTGLALLSSLILNVMAAEPLMKKAEGARIAPGLIVVDGKLDDAGWQNVPIHSGFEPLTSTANRYTVASNAQTFFQVAWDATTLYVGVRCNEPNVAGMRPYPAPDAWDAAMWNNDGIELFFDPTGTRECYYHFAAGPNGAQYDGFWHHGRSVPYSSTWQAKTMVGKDAWILEMAIPLADLHMVPAATWVDTWILSVCRNAPASSGSTMYSPTEGYHRIKEAGTLSGMPAALKEFNLSCDSVAFKLEPARDGELTLLSSLSLANHGDSPFDGSVVMEANGVQSKMDVSVPAGTNVAVQVPPLAGIGEGKFTAYLRVSTRDGRDELVRRFDESVTYVPIAVRLIEPAYRGAIYATQRDQFKRIRGVVTLGMPPEQVAGCVLHVLLRSANTNGAKSQAEFPVTGSDVAFELKAESMKAKDYAIDAEVRRAGVEGESGVVARTTLILPSYPVAPGIEVRVDEEGSVLVDGKPVIVRGFYGGLSIDGVDYQSVPRSINHMFTDSPEMWVLSHAKNLIDEDKAKTDPPLDEAMTNAIRGLVASVRYSKNVLGYYLEEDSGGRGVPASYLKKVYDVLRVEDPYRIVMLTEQVSPGNLAACDVFCNRQWIKVAADEKGTRRFVGDPTRVGEQLTTALQTPGKAVWCGPQSFAYAEEMGDLRLRYLNPVEQRYVMMDCLARGSRGYVCHMIGGYLNNGNTRLAIGSVFEEMAWLDLFWRTPGTVGKATSENAAIRLAARNRQFSPEGPRQFAVVAVNETEQEQTASIKVEGLAASEVQVLREGRAVPVKEGVITDTFTPFAVHVYTTIEDLPAIEAPEAMWARIQAGARAAIATGNLLARPGFRYRISGSLFSMDGSDPTTDRFQLVDGNRERDAWAGGGKEGDTCLLVFEKTVTFERFAMSSTSIDAADLEAEVNGQWTKVTSWERSLSRDFEWQGAAVKATAIRMTSRGTRMTTIGPARPGITELGLFEKTKP